MQIWQTFVFKYTQTEKPGLVFCFSHFFLFFYFYFFTSNKNQRKFRLPLLLLVFLSLCYFLSFYIYLLFSFSLFVVFLFFFFFWIFIFELFYHIQFTSWMKSALLPSLYLSQLSFVFYFLLNFCSILLFLFTCRDHDPKP